MSKSIRPLSGETLYAIQLFWKIEKYNRNIERLEEELNKMVMSIPDKEMEYYLAKTDVNSHYEEAKKMPGFSDEQYQEMVSKK